jgi:O-antigen ligase
MYNGFTTGYFIATNAFGGFVMLLVAQCYSNLMERNRRNLINWILIILSLLYLLASTSRGSILGLMLGILALKLIERGNERILLFIIACIVGVQALILFYTYPIYLDFGDSAIEYASSLSDDTKESNVMIRAYENWPRGLYAFLHSPFFGIGVGALNDFPLTLSENSLFQYNESTNRIFDSSHAHNSYLHILGEQGVIGLFLFLMMWIHLYRFINDLLISVRIKRTLLITFWALTFASFTEHRIPSPSNCFAFFIIIALAHGLSNQIRVK